MSNQTEGMENLNTAGLIADAALAIRNEADGMQKWSDAKKDDFCKVFENRARASSYILVRTAYELLETAERRQFVGNKAVHKLKHEVHATQCLESDPDPDGKRYGYGDFKVGGRLKSELDKIAEARAEEIFQNLPPLRQAVQLIKPDVAKKIDKVETLKKEAKKYSDLLEKPEYNSAIRLSQVNQKMTVAAFRQFVKDRVKQRKEVIEKLNETAAEAIELEDEIAKELYQGVPEICDAILDVARRHMERAVGFGSMTRRVQEHVKFGDSKAAVDMVKQFEQDELAVSSAIKDEFNQALEKLKMTAPMVRKALAAKKKEKTS